MLTYAAVRFVLLKAGLPSELEGEFQSISYPLSFDPILT